MTPQLHLILLIFHALVGGTYQNLPLFPTIPNYIKNSSNKLCNQHSHLYTENLKNLTLWAYQIFDSSVKSVTGHLHGNTFQLGNFDECLQVDAPFETQYCLVKITVSVPEPDPPREPLSIQYGSYESVLNRLYETKDESQESRHSSSLGICLPASCSSSDFEAHLTNFLRNVPKPNNVSYHAEVSEKLCQTSNEHKQFDVWDASFCIVTVIMLILPVVCWFIKTVYEKETQENVSSDRKREKQRMLLDIFSPSKNYRTLFNVSKNNSSLNVLNSLRTLSIFGIIILHRFCFVCGGILDNLSYLEKEIRQAYASFVLHSDVLVDSFFMYSGILVGYFLMVNQSPNAFQAIFMRYVRLTPTYAYVILYYASLLYYTGSGPQWKAIIQRGEIEDCRKSWWTNLLYVNNYVNVDHMCIGQAWYLPCDFHFFIMGLMIILLIRKNEKFGLVTLGILFLISALIPFTLTVMNKEQPIIYFFRKFNKSPKTYPYFQTMYIKSHNRATPYLMGLYTGYMYSKYKDNSIKLTKNTTVLLVIGSFLVFVFTLLSGFIFYDRNYKYDSLEAAFYTALYKIPWCLATIGIMISASHGNCKFISKFFTSNAWNPTAKLSFTAYLIHMQFPLRSLASSSTSSHLIIFDTFCHGLGDIVITLIFSLVLYVIIEMPILNLMKMIFLKQENVDRTKDDFLKNSQRETALTTYNSRL